MTTESEIKVGRPENRARYEECVSKIKKAFADYRTFSAVDTKKCLKYTGDSYVLREDGSFTRIGDKKANINSLEADVDTFISYVNGLVKNARGQSETKKHPSKSVAYLSDLIDKEFPTMSCAIASSVGDGLYWVTKEEYNGYHLEAFRRIVEARTSFDMIYVIPLKYSSFNFEKDSHSGYMDSCEVKCCNESKRTANLESLFTRALSVIDSMGIVDGKFMMDGVTINVVKRRNMRVEIVTGNTVVTLRVDSEKAKVLYSYSCPSTEDLEKSLVSIGDALEKFCNAHKGDTFMNYEVKKLESDKAARDPDYDALVRLLADIFR